MYTLFELHISVKNTNTPTLNEGKGEGCALFCPLKLPYLKLLYLSTNVNNSGSDCG